MFSLSEIAKQRGRDKHLKEQRVQERLPVFNFITNDIIPMLIDNVFDVINSTEYRVKKASSEAEKYLLSEWSTHIQQLQTQIDTLEFQDAFHWLQEFASEFSFIQQNHSADLSGASYEKAIYLQSITIQIKDISSTVYNLVDIYEKFTSLPIKSIGLDKDYLKEELLAVINVRFLQPITEEFRIFYCSNNVIQQIFKYIKLIIVKLKPIEHLVLQSEYGLTVSLPTIAPSDYFKNILVPTLTSINKKYNI